MSKHNPTFADRQKASTQAKLQLLERAKAAAAAGIHVLCEKPCAANTADLLEMIGACRRHHVQFMDGVMFMHSRRLLEMARYSAKLSRQIGVGRNCPVAPRTR